MARASEIRFGVEIECAVPREYVANRTIEIGGYHAGIQIDGAPEGWNAQHDGSIVARGDFIGAEIVSPILKGEDGLIEVVYMLDFLTRIGAKVNSTCGLHVHVDASGLSYTEIARVREAFVKFETAYYGLNGRKARARWENSYCRPSPRWDGGRYQSLNMTNLGRSRKNTLEVRCWAASLDPEIVVGAITMTVGLVALVANNVDMPEWTLASPAASMRAFIARLDAHPECKIVPDAEDTDVTGRMQAEARRAEIPGINGTAQSS